MNNVLGRANLETRLINISDKLETFQKQTINHLNALENKLDITYNAAFDRVQN